MVSVRLFNFHCMSIEVNCRFFHLSKCVDRITPSTWGAILLLDIGGRQWPWSGSGRVCGPRAARSGRARLGMTLEPLLWLYCYISGICFVEYMIGTQEGGIPGAPSLGELDKDGVVFRDELELHP